MGVGHVYLCKAACRGRAVDVASHHLAQAPQVVAVHRAGNRQRSILVFAVAHKFFKLARIGQQNGIRRGYGQRLAHALALAVGGVGLYLVGGILAQSAYAHPHANAFGARRLSLYALRVARLNVGYVASSGGYGLVAVVRYFIFYNDAHWTLAQHCRHAHRGPVVWHGYKGHRVAMQLHTAVGAMQSVVVHRARLKPRQLYFHLVAVGGKHTRGVVHLVCRAVSEAQLRHVGASLQHHLACDDGLSARYARSLTRYEARLKVIRSLIAAACGQRKQQRYQCGE